MSKSPQQYFGERKKWGSLGRRRGVDPRESFTPVSKAVGEVPKKTKL